MSHFTRVKTVVRNLVSLKNALDELGLVYEESVQLLRVRGWQGAEELAQLVIKTGTEYDIGVRATASGEYEFVADWWALEEQGIKQKVLIQQITQRYAYHEVKEQVKRQGYTIEKQEVDEDGSIRLKVGAWR